MSNSATFEIADDADDVVWWSVDAFNTGGADYLRIGKTDELVDQICHSSMRYVSTIPKYAKISTAYLLVYGKIISTLVGYVKTIIYFNDVANAVAPTSTVEAEALALTAGIELDPGVAWAVEGEQTGPELKTILQGIIDKSDYAINNAIQVVWKDNGSTLDGSGNHSTVYCYPHDKGGTPAPPKLYVEWEPVKVPAFARQKKSEKNVGIYDYGMKPYLSQSKSYSGFMSEVTDTYVRSLGYSTQRLQDFKKPYLFKDYNNMMYLFDSPERQLHQTNKMLNMTTDLPRVDDPYFDSAQQVASLSNFNTYAQENFIIMGKTFPTAEERAEAAEETKEVYDTSGVVIASSRTAISYGEYSSTHIDLSVYIPSYAEEVYRWAIISATYGVSKLDYTGDSGTLNKSTGWEVEYTPPYTAPGYYIYVKIGLYISGVTKPCDTLIITVYPIVPV